MEIIETMLKDKINFMENKKLDIIENAIVKYILKNKITEKQLKKYGRHEIYISQNRECLFYKKDLIIQIEITSKNNEIIIDYV